MTAPFVDALADALETVHWDGTGCGTTGSGACSICFGGGHMSSREAAESLMPVVMDIVRECITESYHPEFGTEWREPDGSLYIILTQIEERVRKEERSRIATNLINAMSRFQDDEEVADVWADEITRVWHPNYH